MGKTQPWGKATHTCLTEHSAKISRLLSISCTQTVAVRKLIMENAEVSPPTRHLSAPHYNFIFHITLPDSAFGSIHSLVPGLSDLSVPFLPHTTSAPQSSKPRLARPSMLTFSMQPQQPARCSGGIKTTRFITQVALGKRKTALAPPWLLTLPTHHLYPEKKGQSKAASPSRRAKWG